MPTIKEIRDKYPQYDDMPDGVLAAKLHKKYYSDMPFKDFAAKVNLFETPNKESLYEGFIKPTVKAIPKVVGSTAAQMALMPGAGVKGVADLLGGKSLEEANRGMEETMSFVTPKLNTAEQQGVENIGLAMKPFQMAGEGWGEIGKATGIPYAEPILATMGEASAIFGFGGAGKAAKARVNQAMAPLEGIIPKTQGKPYAVSPEVPRQVDPAYVRAAFEKEQPLALPNASYEGQGPNFIIKPKTILEKGYTVGNVNHDLVVENIPYRKRKITHEVKADVKPVEPTVNVEMPTRNDAPLRDPERMPTDASTIQIVPSGDKQGGMYAVSWIDKNGKTQVTARDWGFKEDAKKFADKLKNSLSETEISKPLPQQVTPNNVTLYSGIDPTQIKNIGKWVANTAPARKIAGFFQPELSVPQGKEWLYSRQQAKGQSAIGEKYAEEFVKKHKDIKPEDRQLIWEQMNSGADIKTLPKELQKPALEFRVLDNSLGRMLVDNGLMSEETFKANAGNHIRYIYNIYQQGGDLAMGMGQKLDTKFIKPRKDLSDLQRQQLGLVKDPIQAIANSIADTHRAVGMAQHFKTIAENPDWVFEPASVKIDGKKMGIGKVQKMIDAYQGVERSGQPLNETQVAYRDQLQTALQEAKAVSVPKDYIQLNGSQYGALDGQYVRKAIAQDIKPILDVFKSSSETANKVVSGIVAANGLWKMKNVALNIPTAARNTISNPSQLLMSGMRPDRVVTRTTQAIVEMAKKGKYHDEALQQGLFKGNFATGELEDIIQIARGFDANNWTGFLSKVQSLGKYYGKIDDVFKLAKFIDVREAGKPATEAAYQANKWGMDYSVAHPAIKILRNSPIGAPFISYQYKIAPLIAESLVKRPWIVGGIASIPWLLQKAVTQNMTDEDATKYIESLPEYVKNKQVFLIPGVNGMNALDVSYMVPWGNWFQVADSVRDTKVSKAFKQMGVASGLLPSVLYGVTTGKDLFTGEKIISDLEKYDPKAAAWATTKWIWQQAAPPMLTETSVVGKVSEHIKHGQTSKGLKTEGMNVWPRIVGVNIYPVDPSGKAKAERFELKNVRKALIRKMYDKNISAEERKAATDAYRMAVQKVRPQPEEERTEETDSEI